MCGRNCFCDYCSAKRNAYTHWYNKTYAKGKRYGETDEEFQRRLRKGESGGRT